jgi:hypothetical protein
MNKPYLILTAAVILTAAFAAHSFAKSQAQTAPQNHPSEQDQYTAVALARTINTAEVTYRYGKDQGSLQSRNHFASWSDLYATGVFDDVKQSAPDVWALLYPDGVKGYKLGLIVSPDGQSYELALHDAKPENALFSAFSDQTGIIYTGAPLR